MMFARRTPDAPRWYRSTRRAARQSVPPNPAAPVSLSHRELVTMVTLAVIALVALVVVVAAISYSHMYDWAKVNNEPEWRARLSPISVDGAILAASTVMYVDARMRHKGDPLAYAIVGAGIAWSVFANVVHDWVSPVAAKLIAGWPPLAMAATVELLLRFARRLRERSDEEARRTEQAARKSEQAPRSRPAPATPVPVAPATETPVGGTASAPAEVAPAALADSLTREMRDAGWAPADYRTAGDAMLGYLAKVDPAASGADLHRLVGVPFFGADPDRDTGRGRQIVRQFKQAQAEAVGAKKEE